MRANIPVVSVNRTAFKKIFAHFCLLADFDMRIGTVVVGTFTTEKKLTNWQLK